MTDWSATKLMKRMGPDLALSLSRGRVLYSGYAS